MRPENWCERPKSPVDPQQIKREIHLTRVRKYVTGESVMGELHDETKFRLDSLHRLKGCVPICSRRTPYP